MLARFIILGLALLFFLPFGTAQELRTAAVNERVVITFPNQEGPLLVTLNGRRIQPVARAPGSVTVDLAVDDPAAENAVVAVRADGETVAEEMFVLLPLNLSSSNLAVTMSYMTAEQLTARLDGTGLTLVPGSFVSPQNTEAAVALLDSGAQTTREALDQLESVAERISGAGRQRLMGGPDFQYVIARRPSWTSPTCGAAARLGAYASTGWGLLSSDPNLPGHSFLDLIGADEAHSAGWQGAGVSILVIDTGFGPFDVYDCPETAVREGHGTFVVELARLVAPRASTLSQLACAANGACGTYDIVERLLQLESDLLVTGQKTITNLSLSGGGGPGVAIDRVLYDTLANLASRYSENFLVVAAAGNNGLDEDPAFASAPLYPAAFSPAVMADAGVAPLDNVVSVGAVGWNTVAGGLLAADFNPRGVAVDVLAPGVRLCLPIEAGCPLTGDEPGLSGSSFASAIVSGAAALLWDQCPNLSAAEVRERLRRRANSVAGSNFGLVNSDPLFTCGGSRITPLGWRIYGDAFLDEQRIVLTKDENSQLGGAWFGEPLDLSHDVSLSFRVYLGEKRFGADGITFNLLPELPLGLPRSPIWFGFPGLCEAGGGACFGVELDTWSNSEIGDPEEDHVALIGGGSVFHEGTLPLVALGELADGAEHSLQIDWDATAKVFAVSVDGSTVITHAIDLVADVFGGNSRVIYGFTGGTGGASNLQYVYPFSGKVEGILYGANPESLRDFDLFLISPDGGDQRKVLDSPASFELARWDRAGERLYYVEGLAYESTIHRILRPDYVRGGFYPDPDLPDPLFVGGLGSDWHSLEDSVIWKRTDDSYTGVGPLIRRRLDTGIESLFIDFGWVGDAATHAPATDFSPDGTRVVWQSSAASRAIDSNLWLAQLDSNGEVDRSTIMNLTPNGVMDAFPRFSPDGSQVAFIRSTNPQGIGQPGNLFVKDLNTLEERQLTTFTTSKNGLSEALAWSPDGQEIAVAYSTNFGQSTDILLVRVSDGSLEQLTDTPEITEIPLDWR